ncbi:hypothetical protein B0H13DRAFT_2293068 [Mycena leptocephala]|nr:hypothetical protein B0H13DRAFT_2293068 [Mycena leptocephala]
MNEEEWVYLYTSVRNLPTTSLRRETRIDTRSRVLMSGQLSAFGDLAQWGAWRRRKGDGRDDMIIVSDGSIFSCRPQDIAHIFPFSPPGSILRARCALNLPKTLPVCISKWHFTEIRIHDGTIRVLTEVHSARVQAISRGSGPLRSFTMLTFNAPSLTYLALEDLPDSAHALSVAIEDISSALAHLTIYTHAIDPAALNRFLMKHLRMEEMYYCPWGDHPQQQPGGPLVHPTIAHPGLTTVCSKTGNLGRVLAGLDGSPKLDSFRYSFPIFPSPGNMAAVIRDLECLAMRVEDTGLDPAFHRRYEERESVAFALSSSDDTCPSCRSVKQFACALVGSAARAFGGRQTLSERHLDLIFCPSYVHAGISTP